MAGDGATTKRPEPKELKLTQSTPTQQRQGVGVGINYVELAKYTVNVRSFHPNRQFEPGGMRFHGDNRGFSLGQSYIGDKPPPSAVTSRVWQRYALDLSSDQQGDLTKHAPSKLKQESNPSAPGPGGWGIFGSEEKYEEEIFKPAGTLTGKQYSTLGNSRYTTEVHGGQRVAARTSWYGGENYAFIGSRLDKKTLGVTVVPTLDVTAELYIRLERVSGYMDIVSLVYGDGFPNAEAFIEDSAGNKLFLGTHVRIGLPSTHLAGGAHKRLMWANAIRIRVDRQGNFSDETGVFSRVVGGPPSERDRHPILSVDEWHSQKETPRVIGMLGAYTMWWNYAKPEDISKQTATQIQQGPLHLSVFCEIDAVRKQLEEVWGIGHHFKTSRSAWNRFHLHRNPNSGRAPDDYDLGPETWQAH